MQALGYMFIILIKSPFWILQWGLKHRGIMVVGVVAIVAVIAIGSFSNNQDGKTTVTANQAIPDYAVNTPPTTYIGLTPSRIYYIQAYQQIGTNHALLTDYYSWNGKVWEHAKYDLDAPNIRIEKR